MTCAVGGFAFAVDNIAQVNGFIARVTKRTHVGTGIAVQIVVVQVVATAEQITRGYLVRIELVFLERRKFSAGIGDAVFQGFALFGGQLFDFERRPRRNADLGKARQQVFLAVLRGSERQHEVQVAKQLRAFGHRGHRLGPFDLRHRRRRGLFYIAAQRLHFVAALNLLDLAQVFIVKQLRAVQRVGNIAFAVDHAVDVDRLLTFPVRPGDHVVAAIVAGTARAQVGEVLPVEVDQLYRVITVVFDLGQGQYQRLFTQVHPHERVGRVRVRVDERGVLGSDNLGSVADVVERRLEVGTALIDGLGVERLVHFHHRVAIQVGFPGNGSGFAGRCGKIGPGAGTHEYREARQQQARRFSDHVVASLKKLE
ncbi:hypothetical protein ALQ18_05152 [Pseudomonas marginalis pv. marginalis]|nr:hypothetical protein ALQ18_05152 [Pseudomonas marginalis pv. marginalis]